MSKSWPDQIYQWLRSHMPELGPSGGVPVEIVAPLETGGVAVFVQDHTTPLFLVKANKVTGSSALTTQAVIGEYSFDVVDSSSMNEGDYLGLFNTVDNRYYVGNILPVSEGGIIGNTITMDTPFDSAFEIGSIVGTGITNMAQTGYADGSVTPVEFNVRGADPGVDITVDVARILISCLTVDAVNLADFGDIAGGLTRGLVCIHRDGTYKNIFNLKTNIGMKGVMFDWTSLDDSNPGQGIHGFVGRLTFSKLGVVVRIRPGEKLAFLNQDDFSSLISLEIMVEGHEAV